MLQRNKTSEREPGNSNMYQRSSNRRISSPQHQQAETTPISSKLASSNSRYTLHRQHSTGFGGTSYGLSPKTKLDGRYPFNSDITGTSIREGSFLEEEQTRWKPPLNSYEKPNSFNGSKYSLQVGKELSSIDKINSTESRSLVVAGKSHLGIYTFDEEDHTIKNVHDFMQTSKGTNNSVSKSVSSTLRRTTKKISTISDVKAGFHNHKNYVAICGTSTSVSIYDINRTSSIDNPLITTLSEHTRSINSVDFNMTQTNLIISGGQDGCIKIWDLRSPQLSTNRSDVSINAGSDSVRDVKWMPSNNFGEDTMGISNPGYKFASVHDSGFLLKFDLRQPNQVEKKINAHSGPGLCMNWHPNQEYIISGGRDGKCSLWYVGDRANASNNSNSNGNTNANPANNCAPHNISTPYSISVGPTSLAFPELTINTAHPLNKLKFRPKYEKNVFNSLIGTSSMGEDSDVSIYSLSRKYVPKNVLVSTAPSLGFVWWNENIVFNIDKQNKISGWNLSHEPTLLENLTKNVVEWRDLDGDGIMFLDQRAGGYSTNEEMVLTPGSNEIRKVPFPHRMSTATANSLLLPNSGQVTSNSTVSSVNYNKNGAFGMPQHHHQSSVAVERPSLSKYATSLSNKLSPSLGSSHWPNMHNTSHHNSVISGSESALQAPVESSLQSPYLISLDLPHILSSIRNSRLQELKKQVQTAELLELKSSPTEVFKFLARELKFSYKQEKPNQKENDDVISLHSKEELDNSKIHLMEKLGLAENNTWSHLIRYTKSHESEDTTSKATEPQTPLTEKAERYEKSVSTNQHELDSTPINDAVNQNKVKSLIDIITACDKNAETYLMIEDFTNYKVWLMMRDALLWDLKELSDNITIDDQTISDLNNEPNSNQPWTKNDSFTSLKEAGHDSIASSYSSFSATDLSSSLNTKPRNSYNEPKHLMDNIPVSMLKAQIEESKATTTISRKDSIQNSLQAHLEEIRNMKLDHAAEVENAIEEEEGNQKQSIDIPKRDDTGSKDNSNISQSGSLDESPDLSDIHNRRPRTSFIDTFISQLRSPGSPNGDQDYESIASKRSSMPSFSSSTATFLAMKKNLVQNKTNPSKKNGGDVTSILESDIASQLSFTLNPNSKQVSGITALLNEKKRDKEEITPPWSSKNVIQQIYEHSVATGNILLTMNILLLFQDMFHLVDNIVIKDSIAEFTTLLHRYELFEIAAELLKYCPYDDISASNSGQSTVRTFCDSCGKLLVNEESKEKFTAEFHSGSADAMHKFGYWYCDLCSKKNTLCCYCNTPMKSLALCLLNCGHEAHFHCFKQWFLDDRMEVCPLGCSGILL